jgi:hypothetical protein
MNRIYSIVSGQYVTQKSQSLKLPSPTHKIYFAHFTADRKLLPLILHSYILATFYILKVENAVKNIFSKINLV